MIVKKPGQREFKPVVPKPPVMEAVQMQNTTNTSESDNDDLLEEYHEKLSCEGGLNYGDIGSDLEKRNYEEKSTIQKPDINQDFCISLTKKAYFSSGEYNSTIKSAYMEYDAKTPYGIRNRIVFELVLNVSGYLKIYRQIYTISSYPESKYMKFVSMLLENYGVSELNLKSLIGRNVSAAIEITTDEAGNEYNNITNLRPR